MANGWWEEYKCGCTSETVRFKKDLRGYCPDHGDDTRRVWPSEWPTQEATMTEFSDFLDSDWSYRTVAELKQRLRVLHERALSDAATEGALKALDEALADPRIKQIHAFDVLQEIRARYEREGGGE